MIIKRIISEDEMVSEFLKAELSSARWGDYIERLLKKYKAKNKLIYEPDLNNTDEIKIRAKILGEFRGYKKNRKLFQDFPEYVIWKTVVLERSDYSKIKYIDYSYWNELSGNTGLVVDAVENIKKGFEVFGEKNDQFWRLSEYISKGGKLPKIIMIYNKSGRFKLLEGHVRITSYLLSDEYPNELEVIAGFPEDKIKTQ